MRIAVIGAGLIGLTTAYFLQKSGHSVTLIDRQKGPGLETSFANGGMLTPSQSSPWNSPGITGKIIKLMIQKKGPLIVRPSTLFSSFDWCLKFIKHSSINRFAANQRKNFILADYSLEQLKALRKELSLDYEVSTLGTLKVFRSVRELNDAYNMCVMLNDKAVEFETVNQDRILGIEPALEAVIDKISGGLFFPEDETGDAYKYCQAISAELEAKVNCSYNTIVYRLRRDKNRITGIETSNGIMEADSYVLAAGSFSKLLAKSVEIDLPIEPVKGYSVTLITSATGSLPVLPVIDESRHIAITPFSNRFRIAGMAEMGGYNTKIIKRRIEVLIDFFREFYPGLAGEIRDNEIRPWCGLRPYCCDGVPILGGCQIDNLYLNTGHGHLGWTMTAGSAKLVSDQIAGSSTDLDLSPYHVDRFS